MGSLLITRSTTLRIMFPNAWTAIRASLMMLLLATMVFAPPPTQGLNCAGCKKYTKHVLRSVRGFPGYMCPCGQYWHRIQKRFSETANPYGKSWKVSDPVCLG